MENDELYKFVGQLVLDSHFQVLTLNNKIRELLLENSKLKEQIGLIQDIKSER
jgi:hypothetical protein